MSFKLIRGGLMDFQFADRTRIDFIPTSYTRQVTPGDSEIEEELSSHLAGIDSKLGETSGSITVCEDDANLISLPTSSTIILPITVTSAQDYDGVLTAKLTGYISSTHNQGSICTFRLLFNGAPTGTDVVLQFDTLGSEFTASWGGIGALTIGDTMGVDVSTVTRNAELEGTTTLTEFCVSGIVGGGGGGGLSDAYTQAAGTGGVDQSVGADTLTILGVGLNKTDATGGSVKIQTEMLTGSLAGKSTPGTGNQEQILLGSLPNKPIPVSADRIPGWDGVDGSLKEFSATSFGTPPYASAWDIGKRYFQPAYVGSDTAFASGFKTVTLNQAIYFSQAYVPRSDYGLSNLSFRLLFGGGLGATIHVAVYSDANGRPGELLFNATVGSAGNAINQVDITTLELAAGHYWLGIQVASDTMRFTTAVIGQTAPLLGEKDDLTDFAQGVTQRTQSPVTFGTWPLTASAANESIKDLLLIGLSRVT